MYSLPYPGDSDVPPLKVPYLARCKYSISGLYNFKSFAEYVSSITSSHVLETQYAINIEPSDIQTFLFFGLAAEALGRDVDHAEFIETCDQNEQVESLIDIRVPEWFRVEFEKRLQHLRTAPPRNENKEKGAWILLYFSQVLAALLLLDFGPEENLDGTLELVLLQACMLHAVIGSVAGVASDDTLIKANCWQRSSRPLRRRMVENGWCRKRLNLFNAVPISHPTLYFLSSMKPSHSNRHYADRACCGGTGCSASTTIQASSTAASIRTPLHRSDDCRCQDVPVPVDEVIRILESDGIPLIRIKQNHGGLALDVVRHTLGIRYIAISHLYADRQFGSKKNALPTCQLQELHSTLSELSTFAFKRTLLEKLKTWDLRPKLMWETHKNEQLFWLDTFCIPQGSAHADLRSRAFNLMNLVYSEAAQTLILDAAMQNLKFVRGSASALENDRRYSSDAEEQKLIDTLGFICGSNWMGRAWTFQEGVLSSENSIFRFKESFMTIGNLKNDVRLLSGNNREERSPPQSSEHLAVIVAAELLQVVDSAFDDKMHDNKLRGKPETLAKFINVYKNLQSRSSTKPEDLLRILANLSGFNGNDLSQIKSSDERMRSLVYSLVKVPVELLHSNCERLGREVPPEDSWIPREIIPDEISGDCFLSLCDEGFVFDKEDDSSSYQFFLVAHQHPLSTPHLLSCHDQRRDTKFTYLVEPLTASSYQPSAPSEAQVYIQVGPSHRSTNLIGAQFLVTRTAGDKIFLRHLCPLKLSKINENYEASAAGENAENIIVAHSATSDLNFILEQSHSPPYMCRLRPRKPAKYFQRILLLAGTVSSVTLDWSLGRYYRVYDLAQLNKPGSLYIIAYYFVSSLLIWFVSRQAYVWNHNLWIYTHLGRWTPHRSWNFFRKFFERATGFEIFCNCVHAAAFVESALGKDYLTMILLTFCWLNAEYVLP